MNIPILSKPVYRNRFLSRNNRSLSAILMSHDEDDDDGEDADVDGDEADFDDGDDDGYDGDDGNDDGGYE